MVSDNAKLNQLLNNMASGDKAAFGDFYRQLEKPVFYVLGYGPIPLLQCAGLA